MHQVEVFAILSAVMAAVGVLSERCKMPLPTMLVVAGVLLSFIPYAPTINLDPKVIFFIVLPPLLYIESFATPWKQLKDVGDLVSAQAIGLVLATIFGVAAALRLVIPEMPWAVALAFGAIVSPTDAVAVSAIAKSSFIPHKTMDVIRGESLVNDATGLVSFQYAVAAAVTGTFSLMNAGQSFLFVSLGGIAVGLLMSMILGKIRTELSHRPSEIIASLLSPFVVYLTAEHLHVSGILAVVTTGLALGVRGPRMISTPARVQVVAIWETITYVLNGFTFLILGLQFKPIFEKILYHDPQQILLSAAAVIISLVVIRFVWTLMTVTVKKLSGQEIPAKRHVFVFSWCGMRGVVSLAAALSLPLTMTDNEPFPYRNLLIFLTIVVIAFSLFVQGATLPSLIKWLGIKPEELGDEEVERVTRLGLTREAIRALDAEATKDGIDRTDPVFQQVVNSYVQIASANMMPRDKEEFDLYQKLEKIAVHSQRQMLIRLRDTNKIDERLFLQIQNELDLADLHLNTPKNSTAQP